MIAVIEIGGKQYTVTQGQSIEVDHQAQEIGAQFDVPALLIANSDGSDVRVGTPIVSGSKVSLKVLNQCKGEKIRVFKMKAKKRQMTTQGFRPMRTTLEVIAIA